MQVTPVNTNKLRLSHGVPINESLLSIQSSNIDWLVKFTPVCEGVKI